MTGTPSDSGNTDLSENISALNLIVVSTSKSHIDGRTGASAEKGGQPIST